MSKSLPSLLLVLILSPAQYAQEKIDISLAHGSNTEQRTKEQLQRLLGTYDLSKWIFTRSIIIDDKSIPHSHPTLTLHSRHLKDDELLLSTFVHEQVHWLITERDKDREAAIKEFIAWSILRRSQAPLCRLQFHDRERHDSTVAI